MVRRDSKIVGARISDDDRAVFDAIRFLQGASSIQEVVQPILEDAARRWRAKAEVRQVLEARERYRAKEAGKLRDLRPLASDGTAEDYE